MSDHKNSLDNMSPSQIRVVLEHLLGTMEIKQRKNLMNTFPGLYKMIYPEFDSSGTDQHKFECVVLVYYRAGKNVVKPHDTRNTRF